MRRRGPPHNNLSVWLFDHETNARSIYFLAGASISDYLTPRQLVRRIPAFGDDGIRAGGVPCGRDGCFKARGYSLWAIHYAERLDHRAADSVILHELAEWYLREELHPQKEDACDQLAMALAAPREAVLFVARHLSPTDVQGAAKVFNLRESDAAIRLAEVTRRPLALVRASSVGFAGPEWGWPNEADVRRIAASRRKHPKITRVQASDERQLTLLFGDG